jgi:uncharacterized protein (TIGR03083 family)
MTADNSPRDVAAIVRIAHQEAMQLAAEENSRFHHLLLHLGTEDWQKGTDCARWSVRDIAVHVTASAEAQASFVEFARQVVRGRGLTKEIGGRHWVDGVNEAQLRARSHVSAQEIPGKWEQASAAALMARQQLPAAIGALRLLPLGSVDGVEFGWQPLSYLFDIGFTRDVWMHRIDICRATGRAINPTPEHDGRIVEDIISEWATRHTEPFCLKLTGPAGGTFIRTGDPEIDCFEIDAIECCRLLSGRGTPKGVLRNLLPL